MWATGFILEAIADYQKFRFKQNPDNKVTESTNKKNEADQKNTELLQDKWIDSGLFSVVQHPNYLGELVMWFGLWLASTSSNRNPWEYLTILCPLFNAFLLTRVSGIPMLAAYGQKKWGGNPDYQAYVKNTKKLIPGVW